MSSKGPLNLLQLLPKPDPTLLRSEPPCFSRALCNASRELTPC